MSSSPPLRVLHCPTMTGGHPQGLARAEREIGLQSWAVAFEQSRFAYGSDEILFDGRQSRIVQQLRRLRLLAKAATQFDVVHFNYGQSLFPQADVGRAASGLERTVNQVRGLVELRDLALLRALGRGIVVTYQGDDARQGDRSRKLYQITYANEVDAAYYPPGGDERKRWRIARVARYADRIYALNPDLLDVLPAGAQFLPYATVDPREWKVADHGPGTTTVPIVLHAPSHRAVKGTRYIIEAVERLRAEGLEIDFRLVEGLSRDAGRALYASADLVVDQLLAGWYGALGVECMALGRPVICYIRQEDLRHVPAGMRDALPLIGATPATIYETLREWLTSRRGQLAERGLAGRRYVERWHDPLQIARRVAEDYRAILAARRSGVRGEAAGDVAGLVAR